MQRSATGPTRSSDNFSEMQALEPRRLMAATVALPFSLDFSGTVSGTAVDKDGQGTGFTATQAGQAGQIDINTAKGTLALTADYSASKPIAALETAFDGTTRGFTITSRLKGPLSNLLRTGDQAGIYLGPDQNNCVKITAVYTASGERLQFTNIVNGRSVPAEASTYITLPAKFSALSTLDLQITGDSVTGQVNARYAMNGKSWQRVGFNLTVPAANKAAFFNSASKTGVVVSDRHGPITATFDSFSIAAGVTAYVPVASLSRQRVALSDLTTSGSSAAPQTIRITNTGEGDLVLSGASFSGDNAGEFKLTNPITGPITLKSGQRYDFYVTYTATNSGTIRNATLTFATNDPSGTPASVALRGLGMSGAGGTYEPSLQRVIDIYGFKTNVGQTDVNNNAFDSTKVSVDEVKMPRLVKAGQGPISVELLGVFANQNSKTTLGWYEAGNPQSTNLVGGVTPDKAQSLSPLDDGILYFDPGTGSFGLYGNFTLGSTAKPMNRSVYSEDVLNASWETNSSKQKKVRFYQLRDADGQVVPNAYIFTMEEYNVTFDQNDMVGIIRNVQPAASAAELGLENLDGVPAADQLVMSRVRTKNTDLPNQFHDISTLRLRNTGDQPLVISDMVLSNADFVILSGGGARTLAPGAYTDIKVQFVFNDASALGNKLRKSTLTITSNDSDEPTKTVKLNGLWQSHSENQPNGVSAEPTAETIVEAFGYTTKISTSTSKTNTKGYATAAGDEVMSELWQRADTGLPVTVRMLATYHQQYDVQWNTRSSVSWYDPTKINTTKGKPTLTMVVAHDQVDSQSLLPRLEGSSTAPAVGSFIPGAQAFGFNVDSYNGTFSQASYNTPNDAGNPGHGWRFYVAKDAKGNIIPDTYIACQDYVKVAWANYDYQDNILLITNIKPNSAPQAVQAVNAVGLTQGTSVAWTANTATDVTSYNVWRRTSGGSDSFVKIANATGSSFADTTAVTGQSYDYYVTAVAYQGGESAPSATVSTTAGSGTVAAPTAPTGVVATANAATSVTIKWSDTSGNETGFRIERKISGGAYSTVGTVNANVLTFTDGSATASTGYTYRVIAVNAAGESVASNESSVVTPAATPGAPVALTGIDIGNPTPAGTVSTVTAGRDYDVRVGGADIYGNADSFNFLYGQKTGDFDVSVRVTGLTAVDPSSQAGLMVRESLTSGSKNVHIKARANGLRLTYRTSTSGATVATGAGEANLANCFLRLQRVGNVFTTYTSTDGQTWTKFGSVTLTLGSTVYVGLATCAKNQTTATVANYRGYGDTGSTTTTPTTPTNTTPDAPSNLVATATSSGSVALTWADNANNETGYRVERQTAGVWSTVATLNAGTTSHTDTTVSASTVYSYRVVATGSADSAASNTQTVTTPAASSTQQTRTALADAYVFDSSTGTNYGSAPTLQVKKGTTGYNRQGLIKFDVSSLSNVNTAKLRLFANLNTADTVQVAVYGVAAQTWSETGVTWANKPASGSLISTATVSSVTGTWIEIDVSAYVKQAVASGQQTITLSLQGTASSTAYVSVASRDSGPNGSQLVIA